MSVSRKLVVVGARGVGKTLLIGKITGIYLGLPTVSPVEWRLTPSKTWSASVFVAYYVPHDRLQNDAFKTTTPQQIGPTCTTPVQLQAVLKKATLLAHFPALDQSLLRHFSKEMTEQVLRRNSGTLSGGVIHVNLFGLYRISKPITIVDMPGIARFEDGSVDSVTFFLVKQIIRSYRNSGDCAMAVVLPFSSYTNTQDPSGVLSFAKTFDECLENTSVIYNRLDRATSVPSLDPNHPFRHFFTYLGTEPRSFAYTNPEIEKMRQDESAFFQLGQAWSAHRSRGNLGVVKVLDAWASGSKSTPIPPSSSMAGAKLSLLLLLLVVAVLLSLCDPQNSSDLFVTND